MIITELTHPALVSAFAEIERDNGGHLIGTVYPGEKMDLGKFEVPAPYDAQVPEVEASLAFLKQVNTEEGLDDVFSMFLTGEESTAKHIAATWGHGLDKASKFINAWFNGWQS